MKVSLPTFFTKKVRYGPVVKRLRHRPFTAVTRVRVSSGSPQKNDTLKGVIFFRVHITAGRMGGSVIFLAGDPCNPLGKLLLNVGEGDTGDVVIVAVDLINIGVGIVPIMDSHAVVLHSLVYLAPGHIGLIALRAGAVQHKIYNFRGLCLGEKRVFVIHIRFLSDPVRVSGLCNYNNASDKFLQPIMWKQKH